MSRIREVRLHDLPTVVAELYERVASAGFAPDCVVYLERGARLIVAELQAQQGFAAIPLHVQRPGGKWKSHAVRLLAVLPDVLKTGLRKIESRIQVRRAPAQRTVAPRSAVNLTGRRVLILDDAVDSGASVTAALDWIVRMGAARADVKVAAITVTSQVAARVVDFSLYSELCRFPWSSDSAEYQQFLKRYERTEIVPYPSSAI